MNRRHWSVCYTVFHALWLVGRSSDRSCVLCLKIGQPGSETLCNRLTNWSFRCDRNMPTVKPAIYDPPKAKSGQKDNLVVQHIVTRWWEVVHVFASLDTIPKFFCKKTKLVWLTLKRKAKFEEFIGLCLYYYRNWQWKRFVSQLRKAKVEKKNGWKMQVYEPTRATFPSRWLRLPGGHSTQVNFCTKPSVHEISVVRAM